MTFTSLGNGSRRARRWWVVAAALLLVAVGCLTFGLTDHRHPLAGPVGPQLPPPAEVNDSALMPSDLGLARSIPITLSIPAIGVSVPLSQLGLNWDGSVQVPTDVQEPGWYRFGPSPGQVGSAVILGHVDSYQGAAVFYELPTLQAGDQVQVGLADGVVADFVVDTVVMYPKVQFPSSLVYASHGYSALQLVTCGGTFDAQTGHYLSNVVVYTSYVSSTPVAFPGSVGEAHDENSG